MKTAEKGGLNMRKAATTLTLAMVLALAACGDEPPKTIKEIDSHILKVEESKDGGNTSLRVIWELPGMSASSDMTSATFGMEKIVKGIVTYFPNQQADEIRFVLNAGLVDHYGNKSRADVVEVPFQMTEIRKINFASDSFTQWDLLNLSGDTRTPHPVGLEFITEYCKEESNAKYARDFCLRSLKL